MRINSSRRILVAAAICLIGTIPWLIAIDDSHAQSAMKFKTGDRVAAPFGAQYLDSVVISVDPGSSSPYRVHPLGYLDTMDTSFNTQMLRARGSVPTQPIGGIANDPWLMKIAGTKQFHPETLYPGRYECWTFSGGGTASLQPAMILNFEILDAHRYRDHAGSVASYQFDPASSNLVFQGGTLGGQRASYEQVSNPPTESQPPTVTLVTSGDKCQRRI